MSLFGNWSYPTSIRFSAGRITELADACKALDINRPLVVTDRRLAALPLSGSVFDILDNAELGRAIFADVDPNPIELNLKAGVSAYRDGSHDGVIALGAG